MIFYKKELVGYIQGSNGFNKLGRYLWAGYDSPGESKEIVIGMSSKTNIEDQQIQMNLYRLLDLEGDDIKIVTMAVSVFQYSLIDPSDLESKPIISYLDGNFIWSNFYGSSNYDVIGQMRICDI